MKLLITKDKNIEPSTKLLGLTLLERTILTFKQAGFDDFLLDFKIKNLKKITEKTKSKIRIGKEDNIPAVPYTNIYAVDELKENINNGLLIQIKTEEDIEKAEKLLLDSVIKKDEGIVSTFINRPISIRISKLILKYTQITPMTISIISFLCKILGAVLVSTGTHIYIAIGALFIQFGTIIDGSDGEVARLKFMASRMGKFADSVFDRTGELLIILSASIALFKQTSNPYSFLLGLLAIEGIHLSHFTVDYISTIFEKGKLTDTHKKMFLTRLLTAIGIKHHFIAFTHALQILIIVVFLLFNKIFAMLLFFAVFLNLYWIIIAIMMSLRGKK